MSSVMCDVAMGLIAALCAAMFFVFGRDFKKHQDFIKIDFETGRRLRRLSKIHVTFAWAMIVVAILCIGRAIYRICI